jgi:FixJ family two-component response regulator
MRVAAEVKLSDEEREQLEKQARARSVTVGLAQRSKMILMAAAGLPDLKIAAELGVMRQTVARWRGRFIRHGLAGIEKDAPRPSSKPQISAKRVQQIVRMTTQEKPMMPPTGARAAWPKRLALAKLPLGAFGKNTA